MNLNRPLVLVFAIIFFLFVIIVLCGQSAKEPFASLQPIRKTFFSDTNETLDSLRSDIESMKDSLKNTNTALGEFRMQLEEMDVNKISPEFQNDINQLIKIGINRERQEVTEKMNQLNKSMVNLRHTLDNNVVMYDTSDYTPGDISVKTPRAIPNMSIGRM
jgi:uncharacterized protein YPO0396